MLNIHHDEPRPSRVTVAFEHGAISFMMSKDATFEDLADRLDRLGKRRHGKPVAIAVKLAAASDAHKRGKADPTAPTREPPTRTRRALHSNSPTQEGSDGQGPEKVEPGSEEAQENGGGEIQECGHFDFQPGAGHPVPGSRQEGRKASCLARLRGENAGMDEQVLQLAEQLLATGFLKLSERERRVITGVAKRTQISRDVNPYLCGKADPWRSPGRSRRLVWWVLDVHSPVSGRADRLDLFQRRRPDMAGRTIRSLSLYLPQPHSLHAGRAAGSDHLDVPEPPGGARPSGRRPGL